MADRKTVSREEWRMHWPLLLAATIGISFGSVPITTLGLFMEPLQNEFGWSRTAISFGTTIFALVTAVLAPFAGALVDKFGARMLVIPGLVLCGVVFASFSMQNGMTEVWIAVWLIYSLCALLIRSVMWNPYVSTAFVVNRGVAIAVLLTGMSIASAASPLITHTLIEALGWRGAYVGLGLGWTGVALLLVIPFFRVRQGPANAESAQAANSGRKMIPGGLTGKEALRDPAILRIAVAGLLATTLSAGIGVHMVPIYTSLGIERGAAATIALVYGISGATSKLIIGSIADRVQSSILPLFALSVGALGYFILLIGGGSLPLLLLGSVVIGIGSGATIHMIMYLTTQYGGLRNFGKIYGSVSALFGLSAGIGPIAAGAIFDATQSYDLYLTIGIPVYIAAGLLLFGLGPYPEFKPTEVTEQFKAEPASA